MGKVKKLSDVKCPNSYTHVRDDEMGFDAQILDFEKVGSRNIKKYTGLKELLGMKLHYIEPVYAGGTEYCGVQLHFIDDMGNQKSLEVDAEELESHNIGIVLYG